MAILNIHTDKIIANIQVVDDLMKKHHKEWSLVVKVLGNNREILTAILEHSSVLSTHSIAVSQWKNLRLIKEINRNLTTMYIKPPVMNNADNVVRYADISFNSSFPTIQALNEAARKTHKRHRIIIMIELGELREGIRREGLMEFYQKVFKMDNIEVIGIGANLGCMIGVKPTFDKLLQLVLYEQLIEAVFERGLELISGASSIALPLLMRGKIPSGVNHFRIGEAVFLGTSPLNNEPFLNLHTDSFTFTGNIIELYKKPNTPDEVISSVGEKGELEAKHHSNSSYHAVMDFGELDVDADYLVPIDKEISYFGSSSDMTVYDLKENKSNYETGAVLQFRLKYMAVAILMASSSIDKKVIKPSKNIDGFPEG